MTVNNLFFQFEYNEREFEGINEFKAELDKHYNYQAKAKYIPSYAEGAEMWMDLFINTDILSWINAFLAGKLSWELIKVGGKQYIIQPLINALVSLEAKNAQPHFGLRILRLKVHFDDCQIIIGGLNKNFTSILSSIFQEVAKRKTQFENDNKLSLTKIELPVSFNPKIDKIGYSPYTIETFHETYKIENFIKMWKLHFMDSFECKIYDFDKGEYLDAYPNK